MISLEKNPISSQRLKLVCKTSALLLLAFASSRLLAKDEALPPAAVVSAKTVYVLARIGHVGAGKNKPDDRRAKSQVTKALQKWGRYQIVDEPEKADLVMIVTEGHTGTYGSVYGAPGGNLGSGGGSGNPVNTVAPDVLSDTLAIYKAGAVDETVAPGCETFV